MFPNLVKELDRKNINRRVVAAAIGCSEKTLYNKIAGQTEFTLNEINMIMDDFLPEFKMSYLFAKKSKEETSA